MWNFLDGTVSGTCRFLLVNQWLGARLWYLKCWCTGDTAVLHWTIEVTRLFSNNAGSLHSCPNHQINWSNIIVITRMIFEVDITNLNPTEKYISTHNLALMDLSMSEFSAQCFAAVYWAQAMASPISWLPLVSIRHNTTNSMTSSGFYKTHYYHSNNRPWRQVAWSAPDGTTVPYKYYIPSLHILSVHCTAQL